MTKTARIVEAAGEGTWWAACDGERVAVASGGISVELGDWVCLASDDGQPSSWIVQRVLDRPGFSGRTGDVLRWSLAGAEGGRGRRLWQRQAVVQAIRAWARQEGMLELSAPAIVRGTCPDEWLDSFPLGKGLYLATSTEYHIKRLLVGGFQRVYTLGPNFRRGDLSARHNPEFTMLEWGRVGASMGDIEADAERIVEVALRSVDRQDLVAPDGRRIPFDRPFARLTVRDALARHLGVSVDPGFSARSLQDALAAVGLAATCSDDDARPFAFSLLLDRLGESLGFGAPTFLVEWPAFQTSSTGTTVDVPVERSELFIGGLEISDGFPFLRSAATQAAASHEHLRRRQEAGIEAVDLDERYLAALEEGMPPGAGMALGIERLLMVTLGAANIRQVMGFAWDEL